MLQKVILIGFLGRDASVKESKNGKGFVSFTMAVNGYHRGEQKTYWYDIMWFDHNEKMTQYLKKGKSVIVVGDLDVDVETGSDGIARCRRNVIVDTITFNSSNDNKQSQDKQTIENKQNDDDLSVGSFKAKSNDNMTSSEGFKPDNQFDDNDDLPF